MPVPTCECGYELKPGQICAECGDRCEDSGALAIRRPPVNVTAELAPLPPSADVDLRDPEIWLGAHQEMFLAVMNKVTAALTSRNNTLHVSGFIMEPREPLFTRQAVVKIKLNGIERGRIIPLRQDCTHAEMLKAVRAGVRDHMTDEVLRLLDFTVQPGQFRKE